MYQQSNKLYMEYIEILSQEQTLQYSSNLFKPFFTTLHNAILNFAELRNNQQRNSNKFKHLFLIYKTVSNDLGVKALNDLEKNTFACILN